MDARDLDMLGMNLAEVGTDELISKSQLRLMKTEECAGHTIEYAMGWKACIDWIKALPSAQPEIIRCKDCKWYGRADKRRFYRGMDCLNKHIDTIVPDKDFCSRAERRTDD